MSLARHDADGQAGVRHGPDYGVPSVPFTSVLFAAPEEAALAESMSVPEFFADLNIDQIVDAIAESWGEYNLKRFFYLGLNDPDSVAYRQEVFGDLEDAVVLGHVHTFAQQMRTMREQLAQAGKLYYPRQKEAYFLDAVETYCDAICRLTDSLCRVSLGSRGLRRLREYLFGYASSAVFLDLRAETRALKQELRAIDYCVLAEGTSFTVRRYESEPDYSVEVEETFRKFQQGAVKDYRVSFSSRPEMNHIEEKILEFVARLHPDVFAHVSDYCQRRRDYLDAAVGTFDREVHFYIAYLTYIEPLRRAGLRFCYPRVTPSKEVYARDGFDLALAMKLTKEKAKVVCNDLSLRSKERILVVTGPNQGGKTTFARMFGQLHYLGSLGCPVPGRTARLFLFDGLFTHFEREESIDTLRGKLKEDLVRIRDILTRATPNSILIINEVFNSTALQDAIFLSREIMTRIVDLDALCVWVTFVEELATFSEQTVSMVSCVVPENPALRTFKVARKPADGLSYAMSIAEKYGVTHAALKERLRS
jgi:DNA mismatch repair protein MutS